MTKWVGTRVLLIGVVWIGAVWLGACASTEEPSQIITSPITVDAVKSETILPRRFDRGIADQANAIGELVVPANLMRAHKIVRPKAELREGPGTQFPLNDQLLVRGDRIFVFDDLGVWRKVVVDGADKVGWVHYQTVGSDVESNATFRVPTRKLPTVIVLNTIDEVHTFPHLVPKSVKIPKGAMFYMLMKTVEKRLVWIPETNSVMWIPGRDVR